MRDDGWDAAVKGCDYVLHVASPVYEKNMQDENSFIQPAKEGLLRALKPAVKYKIKRFVMTSSIAAITQGHEDKEIDEILSGEKELGMLEMFKLMVKLNSRVKQLYQQTYNPPTNNDLSKSINDLSARINILETKLKQALK